MDFDKFQKELDKVLDHLKEEFGQVRTGRASTEILEGVKVKAYDTVAPLTNYANISVADAKSMTVQPWDDSIMDNIVAAIDEANLGLSVVNEGEHVRATVPDMTEERRKDMVKVVKSRAETARQALRNVRQEQMQLIDMLEEDGLSEDTAHNYRDEVEKRVKESNEKIETMLEKKESDLMTI